MKKIFTLLSMVILSMTALAGTDNQPNILNGGFEDWGVDADVAASKAVEPRYWHSFTSAYGTFKAFAGDHCFKSEDAHSGSYSAMIKASSVWGVVANGTLTTGRLKAGAMIADDPNNHSELDMSSTEKDRNKDPFYQVLEARPDSIAFWVKYSTGKAGTKANMSAYITDGTYYQAPEDKTYNNKVGWAEYPSIAACSEWTRISTSSPASSSKLRLQRSVPGFSGQVRSTTFSPSNGARPVIFLYASNSASICSSLFLSRRLTTTARIKHTIKPGTIS